MAKKLKIALSAAVLIAAVVALGGVLQAANVQSNGNGSVGKIGFFGGITEGRRLPKTTEQLIRTNNRNNVESFIYREVVFLTGTPVEIEGMMTIRTNGSVTDEPFGTYRVTYEVRPVAGTNGANGDNSITRTIQFDVNWRREGNQVVRNFAMRSWVETVRIGGEQYRISPNQSRFTVSSLEDVRPGATYYRGTLSMYAVYINNGSRIIQQSEGHIYGYSTAWSNTESQLITTQIMRDDWQMQIELRPSVSVNKTLQFFYNSPTAISFMGNYVEIMQNRSLLSYDIQVLPNQFIGMETRGSVYITTFNDFEHLPATDTSVWRGHFAEGDINKLFAMNIIDGDPRFYVPGHAVTRSEFVTMLVRAIKLPVEPPEPPRRGTARNPVTINVVFPDVMPERPDFRYIMAAFDVGLAIGRGNGHFEPDSRLTREEIVVLMVRALGLTSLSPNPTPLTPFSDDAYISDWARQSMYVAERIGLIYADWAGNIHPQEIVHKGEAAALIVRLIEYMRHDLQTDYTEHLLFF